MEVLLSGIWDLRRDVAGTDEYEEDEEDEEDEEGEGEG